MIYDARNVLKCFLVRHCYKSSQNELIFTAFFGKYLKRALDYKIKATVSLLIIYARAMHGCDLHTDVKTCYF